MAWDQSRERYIRCVKLLGRHPFTCMAGCFILTNKGRREQNVLLVVPVPQQIPVYNGRNQ